MSTTNKQGTWTPGRVIWRELMTNDVEKAKGFYGECFGWKFGEYDMGPNGKYTHIGFGGEQHFGGIMKLDANMKAPPFWTSYVSVEDVDASCEAAKKNGGQVHWGPVTMPNVGRMAMIADFNGAVFSVMRGEKGDQPPAERPPMWSFCWESVATTDVEKAKKFYGDVCGWKYTESKEMPGVGMFTAPDNAQVADCTKQPRAHVMTYVVVENLDNSRNKAEKLGAKVMEKRIDMPKIGSIAVIADPTGAVLGLFQPSM